MPLTPPTGISVTPNATDNTVRIGWTENTADQITTRRYRFVKRGDATVVITPKTEALAATVDGNGAGSVTLTVLPAAPPTGDGVSAADLASQYLAEVQTAN